MTAPVFIGDELSAAGYRLAGVRTWTPDDEELLSVFRRAREEADLILLNVEYARRLPAAEVQEAQRALRPQLFIVPDIRHQHSMRDLLSRIHNQLGMQP
ncbi:V-type ATP synthase subunit F [Thiohalomonas denitrificans]|uniref:ATP synthase F subunit n=1 Tax=Thiohalomonas denitrificans TaxID=415747 RepID=A0A1G5PL49_9GAMM|nr:V-type ATP synthase subunit F [Thiohalomonas denitrificans]SCZ50222.1 ATP synthase F subunit [Thiohalomonas denitrificans]